MPYLGAQYFKNDFNYPFTEQPGSLGFSGGVKYFLARKAALDLNANYLLDLAEEAKGGYLQSWIGISFLV